MARKVCSAMDRIHISEMVADYSITAVALVLSNWHNVLRAISMASSKRIYTPASLDPKLKDPTVKIPKPKDENGNEMDGKQEDESEVPLPQTLVRIPTKDAPKLEQVSSSGATGGE
jgi:DASH complex subunit DAD2